VSDITIKHTVRRKDFNAWLEKKGGVPEDVIHRKKVRQILGLPIVGRVAHLFRRKRWRLELRKLLL
jgi:hypothetical protein